MELKVINGGATLKVSEETFGKEFNQSLVHQVVTAYRNGGRAGTKAQLTKAEVRGGGRKPRPQKGGGTSRAGSIRSPIWVGGGRAFAAKPRDFAQKVNTQDVSRRDPVDAVGARAPGSPGRHAGLHGRCAEDEAGRREAQEAQASRACSSSSRVSTRSCSSAARNLPHVEVLPVALLNPLSLVSYDKVLVTVGAVKLIEERLQ